MSLAVRLNGEDYTDFISASVFRSIETVSRAFAFKATASMASNFPIKKGDAVQIVADNQVILTGFVEVTGGQYDNASHNITISGRDKLGDLVDSTTNKVKEFTGPISLQSVARKILDDIGLTDVKVINEAGEIAQFAETDLTSAEVGESAFSFLEKYARKRQVFLTSNGESDLVLARASSKKAPVMLQMVVSSDENNIKSATWNYDDSKRYNVYQVYSQLNPLGQDSGVNPSDIADQNGKVIDSEIRATRILELNAEESMDSETAVDRAKWESNIRRARGFDYSNTVQGHTLAGFLWDPNILVQIKDEYADISADLLLRSVESILDLDGGNISQLSFAKRDSYTLQAEEDQRQASTEETGGAF